MDTRNTGHVISRSFRGVTLYLRTFIRATSGWRWTADRADALRFETHAEAFRLAERAAREWGAQCAVIDANAALTQPAAAVAAFCLIFDDPTDAGAAPGYVLVLNSLCGTMEELRILLVDRIENGDAFSSERCAEIPLAEYNRRNQNGGR